MGYVDGREVRTYGIVFWVIFIVTVLIAVRGFADKTVTYTDISRVEFHLIPNVVIVNETSMEREYFPIGVRTVVSVERDDNVTFPVTFDNALGQPRNTTYTPREIYQLLPPQLQGILRDIVNQTINEDISQ